ncbi:MAG: hypothetical protein QXQ87_04610 [Halobacteria archaeon]
MEENDQSAEFRKAEAEGRQPVCVHCGQPLEAVVQEHFYTVFWRWDANVRRFAKWQDDVDHDKPICESCETRDWDFVGNHFIDF